MFFFGGYMMLYASTESTCDVHRPGSVESHMGSEKVSVSHIHHDDCCMFSAADFSFFF